MVSGMESDISSTFMRVRVSLMSLYHVAVGISYRRHTEGLIRAGMVLTIEPGFYLPEKWGVRIENCYEVVEACCVIFRSSQLRFRRNRPTT